MTQAEVAVRYDDDEDLQELLAAAAAADGVETETPDRLGIEPFLTIVLIGAAAAVGGVVIDWLRRRRRNGKAAWGQIVDLRPGVDPKDVVRRDEDLEWGQVVIIVPSEDGKSFSVKMETYDPDNDLTELSKLVFTKLSEGVFKTAKEVKDLVESILKDKGKVEVKDGETA